MKNPLDDYLGYHLSRATLAKNSELNGFLKPLGIRHVDASILLYIGANPGITQSSIGRALGIQRANMVPFIARLETRAWIARLPTAGKSQGLTLSKAGLLAAAQVRRAIAQAETAISRIVPVKKKTEMIALLRALSRE